MIVGVLALLLALPALLAERIRSELREDGVHVRTALVPSAPERNRLRIPAAKRAGILSIHGAAAFEGYLVVLIWQVFRGARISIFTTTVFTIGVSVLIAVFLSGLLTETVRFF